MTQLFSPERAATALLAEEARLLRELRAVTNERRRIERRRSAERAEREERLERVRSSLERVRDREERLRTSNPQEVEYPRRMIAFAEGCCALDEQLAADVYLSHDNLPMLAATMLRDRHGGRIVYDAIEIPDFKSRSRRYLTPELNHIEAFLRAYSRGILDEAETVMTVGKALEAHITGLGFRSVAVQNYRYYNEHVASGAIRADCGAGDDDVLALQLNNVYPTFGFETILEYWSRLPERFKLATLGWVYPEQYKQGLLDRAEELGMAHRLTLLDPVEYEDLADYAGGADFMLMKRTREIPNNDMSMPNRIFDALASRLPICSSELTEIKQFIAEHELGTTYDPDSFESFAAAVEDMTANGERYRAGVERAARECVWDAHDPVLRSLFGEGGRVTILGLRDVCNNRRCGRIADTLLKFGNQVTIVGPLPPETPDPRVTYHAVDIEHGE